MKTILDGIFDLKLYNPVKHGISDFITKCGIPPDQEGQVDLFEPGSGVIITMNVKLIDAEMLFLKKRWRMTMKIKDDVGGEVVTAYSIDTRWKDDAVCWTKANIVAAILHLR